MSAGAVAKVGKPVLRGHLNSSIKRNLIGAFLFGTVNATLWWYFVCENRKQVYRNFYATYDPDKEFERMKKAGIFKGIPSEDE